MLPTKFKVSWPVESGEDAKNRFSRWPPLQPPWISDQNDFSYFRSASNPDVNYQVSSQLAFWFRSRSVKQIFKMSAMAATLDFRLERCLLFFICKSPRCYLPSFKSIGLLVHEKKRKIYFQDGRHTAAAWISNRNDFSYF